MKRAELIFIPSPGVGHLVSTLEFSKRLIERDDRISITVLVMKFPIATFVDEYTKSLTASQSRIQLIGLPPVDPPPPTLMKESGERYLCSFIESYIPHVKNVVKDIVTSSDSSSGSVQVAGLVLDFFCVSMIDVANEFGLPSYMFLTTNAGFLDFMLHLPTRHKQISFEFEKTDPEILLPGFLDLMLYLPTRHIQIGFEFEKTDPEILLPGFANPVPPCVLLDGLFNKQGGYSSCIKLAQRFKDVKGIIVNTFVELETYTVNSFSNAQIPPVYPVGPVLEDKRQPHPDLNQAEYDKIMKWLDDQPQSSVVFLCFGSRGSFEVPQVREIALGLEQSGCRFLWSIRVPPTKAEASVTSPYTNYKDMLPEGFLERIKGRGKTCGWAPQVEVLAHKSIGGFISHCGWNSILESLWHGVPIVTWPMYAEQQLNAFEMVKELGLALELRLDYRSTDSQLVTGDEIERAIRCLMNGDEELRKKVKGMSEMARKALMDGGSSFNSIGQLIEDMIGRS
ncbi:UDPGT domain-containing protein [Cephalotus follicularis]|uniref:Glycosyltransferase n=1 Tax=Cephalotus follicularis TaxID=3775 RepID=A0A1Q3D9H6_CEPFO|nr:UDPGT domain-containing protein [Cephalotus follicularis]